MRIAFDGIRKPVEFRGCPEVVDCLQQLLSGWRFAPAGDDEIPELTISRRGAAYRITAPWIDGALRDGSVVGATCSLLIDIVHAFLKDNPSLLCLHCGAAIFGGRAVVFPSTNRAGKSTLIARLAMDGVRILCDDLLPLDAGGRGQALGIAPRPRLPLPACAGADFRSFVADHAGPADQRYQYLRLPSGQLSRHGEIVPLGAVVLLSRQSGGQAFLRPTQRGEALRALVRQNLARDDSAAEILARLHAVAAQIPVLELVYSDLDEAATLLGEAFSHWPPKLTGNVRNAASNNAPGSEADGVQSASRLLRRPAPRGRFIRSPDAMCREVDGEFFLVSPAGTGILSLNAVGSAVWALLQEPLSVDQVAGEIGAVFTTVAEPTVAADVASLFRDLQAAGLIVKVGA